MESTTRKDVQLTDDESKELTDLLKPTIDRHVKKVPSFIPGFVGRAFDAPVNIRLWNKVMPHGMYLLKLPPEGWTSKEPLPDECSWAYTFGLDEESARRVTEDAEKWDEDKDEAIPWDGEGVAQDGPTLTLNIEVQPVIVSADRDPLHYHELVGWHAIQDAEEAGDTERARRIFDLMYVGSEEGKTETTSLPRQDVIKPIRQYDPDSKLARKMDAPGLYDAAGATLDVASLSERKKGREVVTAVSFSADEGVELSRPMGAYDREVHRAVSSLWVAGNRYVTPQQVAKTMGIRNPTANQIRKVRESIDLQCSIRGEIDFSEEARGRRLEFEGEEQTPYIKGHLINADEVGLRSVNGRTVTGYYMYRAPLIYQHAAMLGQVIDYPQRWLELGDGSDTDRNILLRGQLLRQVSRIKHARHKGSNNIRFTTDPKHPDRDCLFSRAGVDQSNRHAKKKATEFVLSVLDALKAEGAIKGYTLNQRAVRGGKSTYGVTIKP